MDVCRSVMGPERVLPNSEDERPADGALLPVWSGGEGEGEEEAEGGEMELDGEEEEEVNSGGYYYQPLNQEPEQPGEEGEDPPHTEQLQQVQQRIEVSSASCLHHHHHHQSHLCLLQVMGLHLPEAPPPDSDEEDDPEGAAAQRSRASIPMDAGQLSTCPLWAPVTFLPPDITSCFSSRPRGAGEEDDGGRGVAISWRAVVGQRDLG